MTAAEQQPPQLVLAAYFLLVQQVPNCGMT
jgi:hypothetical protein